MSGISRNIIAGFLVVTLTSGDTFGRVGIRGGSIKVRSGSGSVRVGRRGVRVSGGSGSVRVQRPRPSTSSHSATARGRGGRQPHWPGYHGARTWSGGSHHSYHDHYHDGRYGSKHWWRGATAAAVSGWIAHGRNRPVYYSYGPDGNVRYENEVVFVDGGQFASADEFYQQAVGIAAGIPEITDDEARATEWLPLGVFAVAGGETGASNQTVQLAVSREGVITGTWYNEATRSARPVEGTVDADTRRAAWTFADGVDTHIVMETSVYNLTEDSAEVLVHFSPEISQDWILYRLEDPDATEENQ